MIGWGKRQRRKGQNEEIKNGIESENDDGAEDADDTEIIAVSIFFRAWWFDPNVVMPRASLARTGNQAWIGS